MQNIDQLIGALQLRNWYAVAALVLMLLVQIARKAPVVSTWYAKIPNGWRWLPPIVGGAVAAFVAAFQAGAPLNLALLQALGGALGIGLPSMGGAALLKESHVPWDGGAGGVQPLESKTSVNKIPPLALLCIALLLIACGSPDGEDVGVVEQGLISPDCLSLRSPPPYPIVCGNYCATASIECALSSYAGNPYSRDVVGRPCKCLLGSAVKLVVSGSVFQ
jgi:hypothetical protein